MQSLIVIAIGGNSLIEDPNNQTVAAQYAACRKTVAHLVPLLQRGNRMLIVHGNGPQVGFILRRSELAKHELHFVPLDSCVADTQGAIGYNLQMALWNELRRVGMERSAATVITQMVVDSEDPSWRNPTKPIGSFMSAEQAERHAQSEGWAVSEDAGRGWRRMVPSPRPRAIVEIETIRTLLEHDIVVIAAGGGGIPVRVETSGDLRGAEAVIDKDLAASLLAQTLEAEHFVISTAVDRVALHYNTPKQLWLDELSIAEAERYLAEGHFAPGSMKPKVEAMIEYLRATGGRGAITDPVHLGSAIAGRAGTRFSPT